MYNSILVNLQSAWIASATMNLTFLCVWIQQPKKKTKENLLDKRIFNSIPVEIDTHLQQVLSENLFSFYYFTKIFYLHISLHENELSKRKFFMIHERSKRHRMSERELSGEKTPCTQYYDDALAAVVFCLALHSIFIKFQRRHSYALWNWV